MRKLSRAAIAAAWIGAAVAAHQDPKTEPLALQPADPAESMLAVQQDQQWVERLLEGDLDRREHHYSHLIGAVRRAPELRGMLERWAVDTERPELAWTARLALRELAHHPVWAFQPGPSQRGFGPANPWFSQRHRTPEAPAQDVPAVEWTVMSLHFGPDGVTARVEREVDGERVAADFQAANLEELYAQHPELVGRIPMVGRVSVRREGAPADLWKQPAGATVVRTDKLGVEVRTPDVAERALPGLPEGVGVTVTKVVENTIAASLGLQPGQILVSVNDHPLKTDADIATGLGLRGPDGEVRVTLVDRWGRQRTRAWSPAPPAPPTPPVGTGGD